MGGKRLGVRANRRGWAGVENKRVRVRGQEIRTREGKGKVKGGGRGSILVEEHPAVVEMKIWKGSGTVRWQSSGKNCCPGDHVASLLHRRADCLLWWSNERQIVSSREWESKKDGAEQRGEGSLREVNRHERAGSDEKPGAQTRERGVEEGALSAALPHS